MEASSRLKIALVTKRMAANLLDYLLIFAVAAVLFAPLAGRMVYLGRADFIPLFLLAGLYFTLLESQYWEYQTLGRRLMKIRLETLDGGPLTARRAFLRYTVFTLPAYAIPLFGLIHHGASLPALGVLYFSLLGALLVLNTVFLLFHPHKRGWHDLLFNSATVTSESTPILASPGLAPNAAVISSIVFLLLALIIGYTASPVAGGADLVPIEELNSKVLAESAVKTMNLSYASLTDGGARPVAIQADVFLPAHRFTREFRQVFTEKMFGVIQARISSKRIGRIIIAYHIKKYYGLIPFGSTVHDIKDIVDPKPSPPFLKR